jgi:hypothetical protein
MIFTSVVLTFMGGWHSDTTATSYNKKPQPTWKPQPFPRKHNLMETVRNHTLQPERSSDKANPYQSNSPDILRENKTFFFKTPFSPTSHPSANPNQLNPKPASPHTTQQSHAPIFQLYNTPNSYWSHGESISTVSLSHTLYNRNSPTIRNQQALQQIETKAASRWTIQRQKQGQTHKLGSLIKPSRRKIKHRKNQYIKNEQLKQKIQANQALHYIAQRCTHHYGFVADPNLTLTQNFSNTLNKGTHHNKNQPTNLTIHNLCTSTKIPPGTKHLLGLNLNFCLASNKLPYNIPATLQSMAYNIRTKYHLEANNLTNEGEYIKQIYVKNKFWSPPPALTPIEDKLTSFEKALKAAHLTQTFRTTKLNLNNLTFPQQKTLKLLKDNSNLIIKLMDKNLGPAILETTTYV